MFMLSVGSQQLSFGAAQSYTQIFDQAGVRAPTHPYPSHIVQGSTVYLLKQLASKTVLDLFL